MAFLLDSQQYTWVRSERDGLLARLQDTPLADGFTVLRTWRSGLHGAPVPMLVLEQVQQLLPTTAWDSQHLRLSAGD